MSCRNAFGYYDPTASRAISNVCREERQQRRQAESPKPREKVPASSLLGMKCFEKIREADDLVRQLRQKLDIAPWTEFPDPQEPAAEMLKMLAKTESRASELRMKMKISICRLVDPEQQLVLYCRHLEHWTWKKTVEMLGCSETTARRIYKNALIALEKILKEENTHEE